MNIPTITLSPIDEFDSSSPLTSFNTRRQHKPRLAHRHPQTSLPHAIYTRRMTVHMPETAPDSTYLWGYVLLFSTFLTFVVTVYVIVGTYFVPYTGNKVSFRGLMSRTWQQSSYRCASTDTGCHQR
jgi:hypothetical protein